MMDYIIHNLFSTESGVVWLVLKWALVVLAAGFIGQFGKAFATYLIRRAGEGKGKEAAPAVAKDAPTPAVREEAGLPAGQQPAPVAAGEAVRDAGVRESGKALKARQKAEKKAAKAIKKLFK